MKLVTFDRSVIRSNWSRMNKRPLGRAGGLVRRIARGSIKRRKKKTTHSTSPAPPYSHQEGKTPPFKMIFNLPHQLGTSEIVGMVGFGGNQAVPGLHEHGGYQQQHVYRAVAGKVVKKKSRIVRYPKRPFMAPALRRAREKYPQYWRGALSR